MINVSLSTIVLNSRDLQGTMASQIHLSKQIYNSIPSIASHGKIYWYETISSTNPFKQPKFALQLSVKFKKM